MLNPCTVSKKKKEQRELAWARIGDWERGRGEERKRRKLGKMTRTEYLALWGLFYQLTGHQ